MSDVMLHGVLNMPPEIWNNNEIEIYQRYQRYIQASVRIQDDERELNAWRLRFPNHEYRAQDDCIALKMK